MKEEIKLAIAFYANTEMQIDLLESLKGTTLYNQRFKQLAKQLQKECERSIEKLFEGMDDETSTFFNQSVEMSEVFIKAIKKGDIAILIELMKEYSSGNISVVDGGDHKKFLGQLEKI